MILLSHCIKFDYISYCSRGKFTAFSGQTCFVHIYPGCPAVIPQLAVTITRCIFGSENINSEEGAGSQRIQASAFLNFRTEFH